MDSQQSIKEAMRIDPDQAVDRIVEFLRAKVGRGKNDGICLGVSGGVDSATVAILAVKAMQDPERIFGLHLFDRFSQRKFRLRAEGYAKMLGINFQIQNISELLNKKGIYDPLIVKLFNISPTINRLIISPMQRYRNNLRARRLAESKTIGENATDRSQHHSTFSLDPIFTGFNARHILRRQILEDYASENNLLLVGAANRSEAFIGWYVTDGVDDLPIEPILGLYKNQVLQLASYLGVPDEILDEPPSPDMLKGVGDEVLMGHSYQTIDKVAYAVENGLSKELVTKEGVRSSDYDMILLQHKKAVKRKKDHDYPNFD